MVALLDPARARPPAPAGPRALPWVVPAAAAGAALARLPFAGWPAGPDEAGFLQVAAQWAPHGDSLYGSYWVDRPPLLITLFRLAAATGGLVPLRLLGGLAAAAVVLLVAWTAGQVAGRRAGRWAAVAAAALVVSPLVGALEVNGELLAAPFVALGLGSSVAALRADPATARRWAFLAGSAGVAALLVKQNFLDVLVFGSVLLVAGVLGRTVSRRTAVRLAAAAASGALSTLAVVGVWTLAHGTSLVGVYDAMYPFRLHAAQVVAAGGSRYATGRLSGITLAWSMSGLALMAGCLVVAAARSRRRDPVLLALLATTLFDLVSIALGGGYWSHYLVQLVVPAALGTGILVARAASPVPRAAALLAALASVLALGFAVARPAHSDGEDVGAAIRAAARPGDTLTTLYGEAQVNLAAGLPSPYEHLWSLPIRTLDPRLTGLDRVLGGPRAPTWLVTVRRVTSWGLSTAATQAVISARYHPVATIHGQTVYLLDGVTRPVPTPQMPELP